MGHGDNAHCEHSDRSKDPKEERPSCPVCFLARELTRPVKPGACWNMQFLRFGRLQEYRDLSYALVACVRAGTVPTCWLLVVCWCW